MQAIVVDYLNSFFSEISQGFNFYFYESAPSDITIWAKDSYKPWNYKQIQSWEDFLIKIENGTVRFNDAYGTPAMQTRGMTYLIQYITQHPEQKAILLRSFHKLTGFELYKLYEQVFNHVAPQKAQLLELLGDMDNFALQLATEEQLTKFDGFLAHRQLDVEQRLFFWECFFHKSLPLLENPFMATAAKRFLVEAYGENLNQLKPFFAFMPFVKNHFNHLAVGVDCAIFVARPQHSLIVELDLQEILAQFSLDNCDLPTYSTIVQRFAHCFAKFYGITDFHFINPCEQSNRVTIVLAHHQPMNSSHFKISLLNFLSSLKTNMIFVHTEEDCLKWMLNNHLSLQLNQHKDCEAKNKI